jgi:hypothetical protein
MQAYRPHKRVAAAHDARAEADSRAASGPLGGRDSRTLGPENPASRGKHPVGAIIACKCQGALCASIPSRRDAEEHHGVLRRSHDGGRGDWPTRAGGEPEERVSSHGRMGRALANRITLCAVEMPLIVSAALSPTRPCYLLRITAASIHEIARYINDDTIARMVTAVITMLSLKTWLP